jgi:hypothetical protein
MAIEVWCRVVVEGERALAGSKRGREIDSRGFE